MTQYRTLGAPGELCCLPSPSRIPKRVAGMAFNFSQVEVANKAVQRAAPVEMNRHTEQSAGERSRSSMFLLGMTGFSAAT